MFVEKEEQNRKMHMKGTREKTQESENGSVTEWDDKREN